MQEYIWTRRDGESHAAFAAFREYLSMGGKRSGREVAERIGKSTSMIQDWSSRHQWRERARAYDNHILTAETDGYANQLAGVRAKHIRLSEKLLDHLDERLDHFIERKQDPTMRWTQAFKAGAEVQAKALSLRENETDNKTLDQVMDLIDKVTRTGAE